MTQATETQVSDFPVGMGRPARQALMHVGILNLEQAARHSEVELKELHGMGPKALRVLRMALAERGLAFAASDFPDTLAGPARRALVNAGLLRLEQLTQVSEAEVLKLHGMGPKALGMLREALAAKGLAFATDKSQVR